MSFLVKSPKLPGIAANQQPQVSSYKEAEPIAMGYGRQVLGAHWLSDAFNWREAPAGKNEPAYQYVSIAFGLGSGPIDYVGILKQDGKAIWNFDYTFAPGEDYHDFTINASTALGQPWTVRIYRGTETQTADAYLIAGTGQDHPGYRGLAYAVMHNSDLGKGVGTIPSWAIETDRRAPALGADHNAGSDYGANPIAAVYGLLTETRGGDFDADLLDVAHWAAQADALWTTGISQRTGALTFCHPWFSQATNLADAISQILAYFDGYIYAQGGQLKIGWFPGGTPAGSLPQIAEADLEAKPSGGGFPDWNQAATSIVVVFTDAGERDYEDGSATYQAPANRETGVAAAPARKDRPFIHQGDQAQIIANELSTGDVADSGVTLQVLKSRAVRLDGTPLIPGDLFTWAYGPHALALTCRVVARRIRAGAASDLLEVIRERGAFPQPHTPTADARVPYVPVPPVDVADYRLWFLPPGFGGGRQITCLVNRPAAQNIATKLHLSAAGSAPWEEVLTLRSFAAKGAVDAGGLTIGATTVRIASSSLDMVRMQAQSALAQRDDTLLLLIDDELLSVSTITVVSPGVYDLGVLRGRQGSAAAAHAGAAAAWLVHYDELQPTTHSEFYEVRVAGVYDAGTATKHFKLQAVSADATNDPLPNDPGISWVLPDRSEADSAGTRTFRGPTAPIGDLRVGDIWFQTSSGNVIATFRWDGSAWIEVTDSRISPLVDSAAAANALIADITRDLAAIMINAQDHVADILAAIRARDAADQGMQTNITALLSRMGTAEAAIVTEASTRASGDSSLSSLITSLTSTVNSNYSSVTSVLSTHTSQISANASSITSLNSTVSGMSSSVSLLAAAYISGGAAVAMAGWNLDVSGHAVSLTLITASGPVNVSALVLGACDIMSANFSAGSTGWRIRYDGSAEFQNVTVRGTIKAGTILESGVLTEAPSPTIGDAGSPSMSVGAPGGAPSGYSISYRIGGGVSEGPLTGFPFTITPPNANTVVEFIARADGVLPYSVSYSWNSLFL